jgi:hypothetical protein
MKFRKKEEKPKREAYTQFPTQVCKNGLIKGFGQNVIKLPVGINVAQINVTFLIMIMNKVKENINVLVLRKQHRVLGNTYGTLAIAKAEAHDENPNQNLVKWPSSKATTSNS